MTIKEELEEMESELCFMANNPYDYDTYEIQAWNLVEECGWHKVPTAKWKTREDRNDYSWVECSNCGFIVENYKAVKCGISDTDIVEYKWHACPKCTAKMILNQEDT
jgi:DNA-directed RNA polymerase subunit RPC12/RpoP